MLTVGHSGGDAVSADQLFVRGSGFVEVEDADQTAAGPWQGSASGQDDTVVAGDFVDVGLASDYVVRIVWESTGDERSVTLAENRGPDA